MRFSEFRFLVVLLLPTLSIIGLLVHPDRVWLNSLAFWALIALADAVLPGARKSPAPIAAQSVSAAHRWLLRAYVPLQLALIGCGLWSALQGQWLAAIGIGFSVGFVCGAIGTTLAHELGHSKHSIDRFCGWMLMTSIGYGHFMVEHYRGHHPRAATAHDHASARLGESLFRFLPRTLAGGFASGWALEAKRLRAMKKSWLQSPLLWSTIAAIGLTLAAIFGALWRISSAAALAAFAFFAMAWLTAFLLFETVNYIEHYGLQRAVNANGKPEPFAMMHAWNADHVWTNSLVINLQRHSDHHMHAWKPYPTLEALPGPQLPTGYAGSIVIAAIPPLWFALMHRRLAVLNAATA